MPSLVVRVPDIGEFHDVDVVEVLVRVGERVEAEQALIVIESEKASMEVPSPQPGVVESLAVAVNAKVSEGDPICTLRVDALETSDAERETRPEAASTLAERPAPSPEASVPGETPRPAVAVSGETLSGAVAASGETLRAAVAASGETLRADLLVLGGGPGGYTAAFRAADLGLSVVLVERYPTLGGVCLNVGCIPSKALLHMAGVIEAARALGEHGVEFGTPKLDFERIRARKDEVVGTLTRGLARLAEQRRVRVLTGVGRFVGPRELAVAGDRGEQRVAFEQAILATGSRNVALPGLPDDPRILDSTRALEVEGPPGRLLVIGGGVIGLELATVYLAFGWRVVIVELLAQLLTGADRDLVRPLEKRLRERCERVLLETRVASVEAAPSGLRVVLEGASAGAEAFERVLVAVGRRPNSDGIGLETLGVALDERGFVPVDAQLRTNVAHVLAIGDLTGPPLLAHRAMHQAKAAAEVAAGRAAAFDARAVPSVAYTDPEVAWVGRSEAEAKQEGIAVRKAVFPWSASGRALGMGRGEGFTKLIFAESDGRLIGAGMVGAHAGELVAEATLAIELGADAHDLGLTVHAHPTLSETVALAAEVAAGTVTDLMPPRDRKGKG
jgi:dihydrolipoamide dehydrogenase